MQKKSYILFFILHFYITVVYSSAVHYNNQANPQKKGMHLSDGAAALAGYSKLGTIEEVYVAENGITKLEGLFSGYAQLSQLPGPTKTFLSAKNWDNALLTKLDENLVDTAFKTKIIENPQLVDAWEVAVKHIGLRTNVTALNKIDNILSSSIVTQSKLKNAINGSLGDILNASDNSNLGKILDRLNLSHVNDAHIDKILQRLDDYPDLKQDLLNHPDWFETFDDILDNPGKYWEIARGAELPNNAALNYWAQGYWWKNLRDLAENFEKTAAKSRFQQLYGLADNQIVDQVTLLIDGKKIRIDFLGVKNGKYYLGEAKFTTKNKNWTTDWLNASTDNQKIVFQAFQNGNVNSITVKATDTQKLSDLLEIGLGNNSVINFANTKLDIIGSNANQQTIKSVISLK